VFRAAAAFLLFIASGLEAQNWPQFRGPDGSGVADRQDLPLEWSVAEGKNVLWRVPIEGLAHSSPVIWGERVYLTTAIADTAAAPTLVLGDSDAAGIDTAPDMVAHRWEILVLDRNTGAVQFRKAVHRGVPRLKRHVKASHASATPATDGRSLVALLGTEGLFCFDMEGELRWRVDLGLLDVGYWGEPEYQWGAASSPLLFENLVIVQNDRQKDSFVAAFDLETGREVWRAARGRFTGARPGRSSSRTARTGSGRTTRGAARSFGGSRTATSR
jgi:hypothetical protein